MSRILNRSLIPLLAIAAAGAILAGCQPAARPVPAATKVPGPPPPPPGGGAPVSPATAGVESAPAPAATSSGLLPELVKQIDVLIQSHQDYIAAAEKVQDPQAAKDQVDEFRQRSERSSAAYEDVMIGYGKLSADQQAKFEAYMNEHVLPINNLRRQHQERLEGLLRQSQ